MTNWGDAHKRHHVWLRLMQLADELQDLADEWKIYDADLGEIEDINSCELEQYELPLEPRRQDPEDELPF